MKSARWLAAVLLFAPCVSAHHEAVFGPQSSVLFSRKRFASAQYFLTNEGRPSFPGGHSHIGTLSLGTSLGSRWAVSATLPLEAERGGHEGSATGVQDLVLGLRYFPEVGGNQRAIAAVTVEPPTGNLEHRALGLLPDRQHQPHHAQRGLHRGGRDV